MTKSTSTSSVPLVVERVTRDMLRTMRLSALRVYRLPSAAACESARSTISALGRMERRKYSTSIDYRNLIVRIIRQR